MRYITSLCLLMMTAMIVGAGAEPLPTVTGLQGGSKVEFPAETIEAGVKATVATLESCSYSSEGKASDFAAAQQADHVRISFPKPVKLSNDGTEVSEVVFTQPFATGVFWLRTGDGKILRRAMYTDFQHQAFEAWLKQARKTPA